MSRSDLPRFDHATPTGVRRSARIAMAQVHQSQDSVEKDAPAREMSRKRKFDQLDPGTSSVSSGNIAGEELCSDCQRIDFEGAFQISKIRRKNYGVVIAELGRKGIEWGKAACAMCRLFAAVRAPSDETSVADTLHYQLRAVSFLKATGSAFTGESLPQPLRKADSPCLLVLGRKRTDLIGPIRDSGVICPVDSSATEARPQLGTRGLLPDRIDYHLLRSWHGFCAQNHRKLCAISSKVYPKTLKLIDCRTQRIIGAPLNCSYVALSYVWGQQQSTKASSSEVPGKNVEPRTLSSDTIPSVIKDAMIVTLELGWQYLWVDRYCIDQNDKEKHVQISQMNKVYSCAVLTIVAAAGESANHGLPGVSNTLRRAQPCAVVRGRLLASTMRRSEFVIGSSRWATRGWTYQEAALSIRRLVFTEEQVFFECKCMSCSESHSVPPALLHGKKLENGCGSSIRRGFLESYGVRTSGDPRMKFWGQVREFTARELSYETDSLNAFMGVANHYKDGQGSQTDPLYSHIGLPLDSNIDSSVEQPYSYGPSFVESLLWHHSYNQVLPKRRRGFPSYSWVGWEGVAQPPPYQYQRQINPMARIFRDPGTDPESSTLQGTTLDLEADTVQGQIEVSDKADSTGLHTSFRLTNWEESGQEYFESKHIILPRDFLSRHRLFAGQVLLVDCVLMGYDFGFVPYLMLIEYHGAVAERIGLTVCYDLSEEQFRTLPKTRRRICLG